MVFKSENIIISGRFNRIWKLAYWVFAALLLLLAFSNNRYDFTVRVAVSVILTLSSFGISTLINHLLIPKYLFAGKTPQFAYLLIFVITFSVWINILSVIFIIWYTSYYYPNAILPNYTDLTLLLSGSFLIIMFAAIIHLIKETYSRIIERNKAEQQKTEAELKLKEAKLKLLQGQLHPHFLFNMLNNLYGLCIEKSNATPEVILQLSALLDYMLYECDKPKVPLKDEVEFIRNYIILERLRHDNRLNVSFEIDSIPNNTEIAPLLLFSFVENAFKHGVNKNNGDAFIFINLCASKGMLNFSIRNSLPLSNHAKSNGGIGLKNVTDRLNLIYTNCHKLDIHIENNMFNVNLLLNLN